MCVCVCVCAANLVNRAPRELAERHLLDVHIHALHRLLHHVRVEYQLHKVLYRLRQRARLGSTQDGLRDRNAGRYERIRRLVDDFVTLKLHHIVLSGQLLEVVAVVPLVARLGEELLLEELDGSLGRALLVYTRVTSECSDTAPVKEHPPDALVLVLNDLQAVELVGALTQLSVTF